MTLETALEDCGFTSAQAHMLAEHPWFNHKRKTQVELEQILENIATIYECTREETIERILKFPPFAGLDHVRVVREATQIYGDEQKVKQAILKFPPFAGLDHVRVVREATQVYCDEQKVKQAILKSPSFAGLDHVRVVREATDVYCDEQRVIAAILKFPPFVNSDHVRVVREATQVYCDEQRVIAAILKFPPFVGLDHERVMRERSCMGKIVGLDRHQVIEFILDSPVLASYSAKRYLAGIDVARTLAAEGFEWNEIMLKAFLCYYTKSPYVPGTDRQRISHVPNAEQEPPLLKKMRSYLKNHQ